MIYFVITINILLWAVNMLIGSSSDRSGSGMVLMFTIPLTIIVNLLSLTFLLGWLI